jgi:hypothetical protein
MLALSASVLGEVGSSAKARASSGRDDVCAIPAENAVLERGRRCS